MIMVYEVTIYVPDETITEAGSTPERVRDLITDNLPLGVADLYPIRPEVRCALTYSTD